MLTHVTLGTDDPARAFAFYDALLAPLGVVRVEGGADAGFAGWAREPDATPQFWVLIPFDGRPAAVGNGLTVGFEAATRPEVDAFHARALSLGARDEGPPGLRAHYHPDYYGAYVRDLDGHKLCCACHHPPA